MILTEFLLLALDRVFYMYSLMYKAVINNKPNVDYQLLTNVIPLVFLASLERIRQYQKRPMTQKNEFFH